MLRRGAVFILSSPSGAGKTTILRRVRAELDGIEDSVSYTTRPQRPGEADGVDYHFLDEATFMRRAGEGFFAEWARVYDRCYGTGLPDLEAILARGRDVIMDIDVQGARQMARRMPEAVRVFILPPSLAELRRRLVARSTDAAGEIERRLAAATAEVAALVEYDYLIVNRDLEESVAAMKAIVAVERLRTSRWDAAAILGAVTAAPGDAQGELGF